MLDLSVSQMRRSSAVCDCVAVRQCLKHWMAIPVHTGHPDRPAGALIGPRSPFLAADTRCVIDTSVERGERMLVSPKAHINRRGLHPGPQNGSTIAGFHHCRAKRPNPHVIEASVVHYDDGICPSRYSCSRAGPGDGPGGQSAAPGMPLLTKRGTRVCAERKGFVFYGFVEDVLPDNSKIKISVNGTTNGLTPGGWQPKMNWDQQQLWRVCE